MPPPTNQLLTFQQNLGNVVALLKGPTPPVKTYILWAAEIDPDDASIVELRKFNFNSGQWEPLGSNATGGPIEAQQVHVKLEGVTEAVGARAAADFDGPLQQLLEEVFIGFRLPSISFFTFMGRASIRRPVGYSYLGGDQPFTWGTNNANNVSAAGLTLADLTSGQTLGTQLPVTAAKDFRVDAFVVKLGESRRFRLSGEDKKGANFQQEIIITGALYRFYFISDRDLLDTTAFPATTLSDYLRTQPQRDLVDSRATEEAVYQPRGQYVYFVFDRSLLDQSLLGVAFTVEGQPNDDFLPRDFTFTNEYGAQNNMRLLRTGNLLNGDYRMLTR